MITADFDYFLPPERIAQTPVEPRHASRLLVVHRRSGLLEHSTFWDVGNYFSPGDLLVINRTRVIPARIWGRKQSGGKVELLLIKMIENRTWEVLVGGKGLIAGKRILFDDDLTAEIIYDLESSRRIVRFSQEIEPYLEKHGQMPLPPYIHTPLYDSNRYQTVYAEENGSVAAPTAGLHFTPTLFEKLNNLGVCVASVILHVGLDTFAPVTEENPFEHKIHSEWCEIKAETANLINSTLLSGHNVIAVGTTTMRVLETAADHAKEGCFVGAFSGPTNIYILPGYKFRVASSMITNFHLPRSTLLMMVSAFAGKELIFRAYDESIKAGYRFYSFGDAMLIL